MVFHIGHLSYSGKNTFKGRLPYLQALRELLDRGVSMITAQQALNDAMKGSHVVVSTLDNLHSIEVVAASQRI